MIWRLFFVWLLTLLTGIVSTFLLATVLERILEWVTYGDYYTFGEIGSRVWRIGIPASCCLAAVRTFVCGSGCRSSLVQIPVATAISLAAGLATGLFLAVLEKVGLLEMENLTNGLPAARIRFAGGLLHGTWIMCVLLLFLIGLGEVRSFRRK